MRQLLPFPIDPVNTATLFGDLPLTGTRPTVRLIMITVAEAPGAERTKASDQANVIIAGERDAGLSQPEQAARRR